jgi:RNA polymerase sigma-70 factor (ECF subfamily)
MDLKEEKRLVKKAQKIEKGENKPFGKLYRHYFPKVKRYFLSRVDTVEEAEDLSSQVFEKALSGLGSFQWQGVPFSAWLFKIAQNTLFDSFRKAKKRPQVSLEKLPPLEADEQGPEEVAYQKESEEVLTQLLKILPQREREIVYLKFYEGHTNRAIAGITGLSETNVGTILYRTLKKLREDLQKE